MTGLMRDTYHQFLDKVLEGRRRAGKDMNRDDLERLASGRIWTGRQAKINGLVDELGTLDEAIAAAKELAGLPGDEKLEHLVLPKQRSFFDALLEREADARAPALRGVAVQLLQQFPGMANKLSAVEGFLQLRTEPVWAIIPFTLRVQ
jgi:protease-4